MSAIEKIKIAGIRNFNPNRPGVIKFYKPLTLIVGDNGSGKTTIIESLNTITTGTAPFNCPHFKGFVHDNNLCDLEIVNAYIKVQFRSLSGDKVVVKRQIVCSRSGKKLSTQSNSVILKINGKEQDYNIQQASETLSYMLGVSTAILNHVIFCHQDDSLWPLDDPSKLKGKFDEIFESKEHTNLVKSLKTKIRENIKEMNNISDRYNNVRDVYNRCVEQKKQLNHAAKEKVKFEEEYNKIDQEYQLVNTEFTSINQYLQYYESKMKENEDITIAIKVKQGELSRMTIDNEYKNEPLDYLTNMKQNLNNNIETSNNNKNYINNDINKLNSEINQLNITINNTQTNVTQMSTIVSSYLNSLSPITSLYHFLMNIYGFSMTSDIKEIFKIITNFTTERNNHIKNVETKYNSLKNEIMNNIQNYQNDIYKLTYQSNEIKQKIKNCTATINNNKSTLDLMMKQSNIDELQTQEKQIKEDIESPLVHNTRIDALKAEINDLNSNITQLKSQIQAKQLNIDKLRPREREYNDISDRYNQYKNTYNDFYNKCKKFFIDYQLDPNNGEISDLYSNFVELLKSRLIDEEIKQNKLNIELAVDSNKIELLKSELREKTDEQEKYILEITNILKTYGYGDTKVSDFRTLLESIEDRIAILKEKQIYYNLYNEIKNRSTQTGKCIICNNTINSQINTILSSYMSQYIIDTEELNLLLKHKNILKDNQHLYYNYLYLENEIETISTKIAVYSTESDMESQSSDDNKIKISQIKTELEEIQQYQDIFHSLNYWGLELKKVTREYERVCKIYNPNEMSILTVEYNQMNSELSTYQSKTSNLNIELNKLQNEENIFLSKKNELHNKLRSIQDTYGKIHQLKENIKTNEQLIIDNNNLLPNVEKDLNSKISLKKADENKIDLINKQIEDDISPLKADNDKFDQLKSLITAIEHSISGKNIDDIQRQLAQETNKLNNLKQNVDNFNLDKDQLQVNYNNLMAEIQQLQSKLDQVGNTILYNNIKNEINLLNNKLNINDHDINDKYKKRSELEKQMASFKTRIDQLRGKIDSQEELRSKFETNMRTLFIQCNYSSLEKMIEELSQYIINKQILELTNNDLLLTIENIDQGLIQYHKDKLTEINNKIKDLWKEIYQGEDIDYIYIVADEEGTANKSYNYHIEMIKNGQNIHMRGRCSAGQKVLASLIIRLSICLCLSTFCNIFVLDEPTTNLDTKNKESLAKALTSLISGNDQTSFQFIIITHDEEFSELLLNDPNIKLTTDGFYYRIKRSGTDKPDYFVSTINQQTIDQ